MDMHFKEPQPKNVHNSVFIAHKGEFLDVLRGFDDMVFAEQVFVVSFCQELVIGRTKFTSQLSISRTVSYEVFFVFNNEIDRR